MLAWNKLRLEPGNGSRVEDYRIENGEVEMRSIDSEQGDESHRRWQRLTKEQLIAHVMGNTVVAQWLQRRMGVHSLLRTCAPKQ
jgi:hypothetical protein